jgi:hypothetical protein
MAETHPMGKKILYSSLDRVCHWTVVYLAVFILFLFSIGVYLGVRLSQGKGTDRLALQHMKMNYGAFFFVLIQIVLGVILLTFFLYA